jgi:hypothetical protein
VVALVTKSEDELELPKLDLTLEGEVVEEPEPVTDKVEEEEKKVEEPDVLSENSEIKINGADSGTTSKKRNFAEMQDQYDKIELNEE